MRASLRPELSQTCVKCDSPPRLQRRDGRAVPGSIVSESRPSARRSKIWRAANRSRSSYFLYSDAGWTHWETPKWA